MPEFIQKEFKSIINKKKFIDSWFWDRYTINPYNGCLFGCIYCDARSAKYYMPEDFENKIIIKQNVGKMLDHRLSKARTFLSDVVRMGESRIVIKLQKKNMKILVNVSKCLPTNGIQFIWQRNQRWFCGIWKYLMRLEKIHGAAFQSQ